MFNTVGVCGVGNMGKAIIKGIAASGLMKPEQLWIYNIHTEKAEAFAASTGVQVARTPAELAAHAEAIIMAVKPAVIPQALQAIGSFITSHTVLISIAAGVTLSRLEAELPAAAKVVRVMPNTPSMVGEGMAALAVNKQLGAAETAAAVALFRSFGKAEVVKEALMDAVCGVSGSGPAYVYLFIEALADGAVQEGMPRELAYTFAAQTVLGAAKMVLSTGEHPGVLKDAVCSPGGTTITAVHALEEGGLRATVAKAVICAAEKNREL